MKWSIKRDVSAVATVGCCSIWCPTKKLMCHNSILAILHNWNMFSFTVENYQTLAKFRHLPYVCFTLLFAVFCKHLYGFVRWCVHVWIGGKGTFAMCRKFLHCGNISSMPDKMHQFQKDPLAEVSPFACFVWVVAVIYFVSHIHTHKPMYAILYLRHQTVSIYYPLTI